MTEEELKQKFREDWFKGSELSHNSNTALSIEKHSENYKLELKGYIEGYQLAQAEISTNSVHTCHDQCRRLACVQRREIEKLKAEIEKLKNELASQKSWNEDLLNKNDELEELKADAQMLVEDLRFYADRNNWKCFDSHSEIKDVITISDVFSKNYEEDTHYMIASGGNRARISLKEWNKKRGGV